MMQKYYKILGLEEGASIEEIQNAYDRLSEELDPKNNDNLDFFKEEVILLKEAYSNLIKLHKENQKTKTEEKHDEDKSEDCANKVTDNKIDLNSNKSQNNKTTNQPKNTKKSNPEEKDYNDNNKDKNGCNRVFVLSLFTVLFLLFMITFLVFQKEVNKVKSDIPKIEKIESNRNKERLNYWKNKFETEHKRNKLSFVFDTMDSKIQKDTTVTFFLFSKKISYDGFKDCFFECVYKDLTNKEFHDNFSVVDLSYEKYNNKKIRQKYVYVNLMYEITQKYNISKDEFKRLIIYATGNTPLWRNNHTFIKEEITLKDERCLSCMTDYHVSHKVNWKAINEFEDFVKQYLSDKKTVSNANLSTARNYYTKYKRNTLGMDIDLKNKLEKAISNSSIIKSKDITYQYYGTEDGIGTIEYTLESKEFNPLDLVKIIDQISEDYYINNSLNSGAMPYRYCYGDNPVCSPPRGYIECSYIDVKASYDSDVIVIIKKNNKVHSHAYIKAGSFHRFSVGNGFFETFFYFGKGWNPNKFIKYADCGEIYGGFVSNESIDKSDSEYLYNSSLSFTLHSVTNGNFQPKKSDKNEAF